VSASVVAYDNGFRDGSQSDPADSTVEIAAGETVSFSYPTGSSQHNVVFETAQPSSCVQQTGVVITAAPPLPGFSEPPGWTGECTFTASGTYTFVCNAHPAMTGKVVVTGSATPTATATPTPTASPTATPVPPAVRVEAHDLWFQDASSASADDHSVSVAAGAEVGFSYPSGSSSHNVVFDGAQPSSCTQTGGTIAGAVPPLPAFSEPPGWSGTCRFDTAGTYTFFCQAHREMTGSVVVGSEPPPPATTSTAPPAPPPAPWASLSAPSRSVSTLAAFLGGKLRVSANCSSPSSGTLVLSVSKADAKRLKLKGTELARASARCTGEGRLTVTLKPSAAAKKALKRYKRALKATATLTLGKARDSRTVTLAARR
jgi:plastocyanin